MEPITDVTRPGTTYPRSTSRSGEDRSDPKATTYQARRAPREVAFWSSLVVAPVAIGVGLGALTGSRRTGIVGGVAGALVLGALRWQLQRLFTPEPAYTVERRIGKLEIRRYAPRIEARTTVTGGELGESLSQGFRRLFAYIAGSNFQEEELAMTAPVIAAQRDHHTVAFIMPAGRTMDTLPTPGDDQVRLYHVPEQRVAVLRFTGRHRQGTIDDRERELGHLIAANDLRPIGEPMFAGFDPPSTIPLLRRNEVWVAIEQD